MLTGIGVAGLATTIDHAVWLAAGMPILPIGWTALFSSVGGVALAIAYWMHQVEFSYETALPVPPADAVHGRRDCGGPVRCLCSDAAGMAGIAAKVDATWRDRDDHTVHDQRLRFYRPARAPTAAHATAFRPPSQFGRAASNKILRHLPKSSRLAAMALVGVESTGSPRIEPTLTMAARLDRGRLDRGGPATIAEWLTRRLALVVGRGG